MSEIYKKVNQTRASAYNRKSEYYPLPENVIRDFPRLASPPETDDFRLAVVNAQSILGFAPHECDGLLGWQTYTALLRHCDPIDSEYIVVNGRRVKMPSRHSYQLLSFDEAQGLDLHRFGHFSARSVAPTAVCLHWGGLNVQHCYNVFANASRKVSSHFLIGFDQIQRPTVYQVLDITHRAWHGGWVNDFSVGVDICQAALPVWKEHYAAEGVYNTEVIDNASGRGPEKVLSLDPRLASAASDFVRDLCAALDIPLHLPEDHAVYKEHLPFTVFGHHHVNERKIDVACWFDELFSHEK